MTYCCMSYLEIFACFRDSEALNSNAVRIVSSSDRHNASQIPREPIIAGKQMNEGIRKKNPLENASKVAGLTLCML